MCVCVSVGEKEGEFTFEPLVWKEKNSKMRKIRMWESEKVKEIENKEKVKHNLQHRIEPDIRYEIDNTEPLIRKKAIWNKEKRRTVLQKLKQK